MISCKFSTSLTAVNFFILKLILKIAAYSFIEISLSRWKEFVILMKGKYYFVQFHILHFSLLSE